VQRPLRVVFKRARCPEGRHHRVASELLDRPARAFDLLGHSAVEAIEQNSGPFRIVRTGKRGRSDEISEQHRSQLPLLGRTLSRDRGAAARAKACPTRDLGSATITDRHQPIVANWKRSVGVAFHAAAVARGSITRPRSRPVARAGNRGWSLYGAPWLQPVATGRKSESPHKAENKRKPLPWVATSSLSRSMVSRASAVGCHPLREIPSL
jgi:hypothetical protein